MHEPARQNLPTNESNRLGGRSFPAQLRRSKAAWFRDDERFPYKRSLFAAAPEARLSGALVEARASPILGTRADGFWREVRIDSLASASHKQSRFVGALMNPLIFAGLGKA